MRKLITFVLLLLYAASTAYGHEHWPRFRGPNADGIGTDDPNLPVSWNTTENVKWVADVPGWGWSCPIVWGDRVFLTTVVSDEKNLTPNKGLYLGRGVRDPAKGIHHWLVHCFDLNTGQEVWKHEPHTGKPQVPRHPKSTYAAETATTDGERLYVLFGDLGLYCYDLDGTPLWSKEIEPKKTFMDYGAAASPVVHDDQVIVVYDNFEESWIAAFDTKTGEQQWKTPRDETHSWATPFVWQHALRTEIVVPGKKRNRSYSLGGEVLWEFDGQMSNLVIPSPFAAHGLCYIASGYIGDAHRPTFAIKPGGRGDLCPQGDFAESEFIAWYQGTASAYNTTQIVYGDYLYTLYDQGFITCHDAKTGKQIYDKQRFSPGGSFTSSPLAYNGHLFCLSEDGLTYAVKAGPEFEVVERNALDELCLASPAVVGDKLLIRTASKLYCLTKGAKLQAAAEMQPRRTASSVTDIWSAAGAGNRDEVARLLTAGTDVNSSQPGSGLTPLNAAALHGRTEIARLLIENGADVSIANADGNTALHIASFFTHLDFVKLLLDRGALTSALNARGESPIDVVSTDWSPQLEEIYKAIGGAVGVDVDLQRVQQTRPQVLRLLREHAANAKPMPKPEPKPADPSKLRRSSTTPVTGGDWATYNYDVVGWRFNNHEKTLGADNITQLQLKWRFPTQGSDTKVGVVHATPAVVDGYVYFGTATYAAFYCLSPQGDLVWKYDVGDAGRRAFRKVAETRGLIPQDGVYTSALVTDDSVYFADTAGIMFCLDRETGKEKWQVNSKVSPFPGAHHANLVMASPILADGKVVFGGGGYEHSQPLDKEYKCCYGRGFVVALDPASGNVVWKYDVGPKPQRFDPPIVMEDEYGKHVFHYGPSTSSVWCTPSWDEESNTVYFGTDIHNSPRQPTDDDPRNYTEHSAAVIAVNAADGSERWVSQIAAGDVWNHSMPAWDSKTSRYKDLSIGDTPKIYTIDVDGKPTPVVGAGCKNGGYYVIDRATGKILAHTPVYTDPPSDHPKTDPRMLALPGPIGGLQTGAATDGNRVYTGGIDRLPHQPREFLKPNPPTGGRVTATSLDTKQEYWRHERPKIDWIGGTKDKPLFRDCGDPIASGIAVANGLAFCTTFSSNQLLCLNAETGERLKEIPIGPVLCGPSVSHGQVYVGTGNTQFSNTPGEAYFPKKYTGELLVFGLPDETENIQDVAEPSKAKSATKRPQTIPDDVDFRTADIISEGTRMAAEVFSPKGAEAKLPTIIMSHGWGGTAEALRPDGIAFARAGFLVVTFDYRGWGNSDARLIASEKPTKQAGKLIAEVSEVRGVVDPIDQTTDIINAIHWVQGEDLCDKEKIGIWGSSFSGGHVVYVAARDPRVKAFVSQVGSMDARWAIANTQLREHVFNQGTARARGQIGYPEPFADFNNMRGQPVWEKLMRYAPIEDIGRCEKCAKLFIIAENEELFDNKNHAIKAYERATGIKKLATVKGIKHYGIYREKRNEAQKLAIDWFSEHLK